MTLPSHHPDVAEAVRLTIALHDLVGRYAETFAVIARRPEGAHFTAEVAQQSADALATWAVLLDSVVALLLPVPLPEPAPPPPAPRVKPRLVALDGEVVS